MGDGALIGRSAALWLALLTACGSSASPSSPWLEEVTAAWGFATDAPAAGAGTYQLWELMGGGVAVFDADGDGDADVLQTLTPPPGHRQQGVAPRLYRQLTPGNFELVEGAAGLEHGSPGQGVALGDPDGDGDLDVFLANLGADRLYRNQGGHFEPWPIPVRDAWSVAAAFVDHDGDGDQDLFVVHYLEYDADPVCQHQDSRRDYCSPSRYAPARDTLLENLGDGRFRDVTAAAGLGLAGNGLGVLATDLSGDGLPDLLVANDAQPNHLWVNQGDGRFEEQAMLAGVAVNRGGRPEASMGVACADVDRDGLLDVFVTHLEGETNTLYRGDGAGFFRDASPATRLAEHDRARTGFGCLLLDREWDGDVDLLVGNGRIRRGPVHPDAEAGFWAPYAEPDQAFLNDGAGGFRPAPADDFAATVSVTRGLTRGDLDGDGDLDVVVSDRDGRLRVFANRQSQGHHWLGLRPVQDNQVVLGAMLRVTVGARPRVAVCRASLSYGSAASPTAYFGLGAELEVNAVEVRWLDGSWERFPVGAVDQVVTLVRGTGERR